MKALRLLLVFIFSVSIAFAQKQEKYSRAKVYLNAKDHTIRDLASLGVAVDHGEYKKNTFFVTDYSASELKAIRKAGFKVQIIIKDVSKHYREQNKPGKAQKTTTSTDCNMGPTLDVPAHFHLGTYGGYFTYTEMLSILDSMALLYPALISARAPIDTFHSIEGRPIYWVRVSNNPNVDQPAKPQMLYDALHHAREPGTISSTIYYLWYLLEHYNTDPQIKAIIDNTELYFVPCVNPDGLLYNISTNPGGGGMWRKNRRHNAGTTIGVDLNRNYGFQWGYDNVGSSPTSSSDTYRGTGAFSEPETQAMKFIAEHHHFKTTLNYHTYGNDLIYPWGYIGSLLTPDSSQFVSIGSYLTEHTPYRYGTGDQTVGYVTNGDSDDWGYGEQTTKNKIFAMTPETGKSDFGFYTPIANIIPDCQNNLRTNIAAATLLLPFSEIHTDDQKIITANTGFFHYDMQRLGYPDTATFTVTMTSLDTRLTITGAPQTYINPTILQKFKDSMAYSIATGTPNGTLLKYELKLYNGMYYQHDTVQFYYGKYNTNTIPNTNTLTDWSASDWNTCSSIYYSAPASIGSSASGCSNYADNVTAELQLIDTLDLTHSQQAFMYFYCRWGIESSYDYMVIEATPVGFTNWQPLCGRFTKPGTNNQLSNEPIYDGQHPDWVQEELNLSDYLGGLINVRFSMIGDGAVNYSGFYIDDMNVITVEDSAFANHTDITGINTNGANMSVFPNPAREQLNIAINGYSFSHPIQAGLYDGLGRKVMSCTLNSTLSVIDVQNLPAGLYYLKTDSKDVLLPVCKVQVMR
ncbi:hypothetical protein CJD36_007285 [Flavipsychrobacter stenotrophus]|uniref:carboxypeptidase T n=1 Tax=Flavipsychrobacter stenotrophus TaxID=2077091 RepID=A0A2S7SY86_9BACT|nr:M14 family zinc carboxypeptidase [Flavipsychrobacter stenotrophus]PQJ11591.1 hypothetical protein CJD36_007285 [Flavipsychrobacter stenotrophus]